MVIVGATGNVGQALAARLSARWDVTGTHHRHPSAGSLAFDLAKDDVAALPIDWSLQRSVVVAGAATSLHQCETEPARTRAVNVDGPQRVFEHATAHGVQSVFLSTTAVLAGDLHAGAPREPDESAAVAPILQYGIQKADAEAAVPATGITLRLTKVSDGFVQGIADRLASGQLIHAATDQYLSLLAAGDVARVIEWAIENGLSGLHHLAVAPVRTRYEWCRAIAEVIGSPPERVEACDLADINPDLARDCTLDGSALARRLPFELEDGNSQLARLLG